MHKHQYLIKDTNDLSQAVFKTRVLQDCIPALQELKPFRLKLSITDIPRPKLTVLPLRKQNLALISIWSDSECTPEAWAAGRLPGMQIEGYAIDESVPVACERDWPDGTSAPGVVLLTLLKQNNKLSYDEFMHEWHGRHTPKAMRIHPFWNYIRNVIKQPLIPDSTAFQGIVEEHFRTRKDCTNPVRMFGGPLKFIPNMIEVGLHAKHFLDLQQSENYLMSEMYIKSSG